MSHRSRSGSRTSRDGHNVRSASSTDAEIAALHAQQRVDRDACSVGHRVQQHQVKTSTAIIDGDHDDVAGFVDSPKAGDIVLVKEKCIYNGNLIFSPVSVYAALSLVTAGARERTLSELLGVLGAPSRDELARSVRVLTEQSRAEQSRMGGPRINFSCGVWHDRTRTLKPAYINTAVESYKAHTCAVDFHDKVS
ncbi:hypothetical protein QYE76_039951 [Lolium multiflorum]|uniref:Serpin domain-containing protein n=1 Tax=Lolium multiflorum TaxID=4521 RepID=A0AAD8VDA1_LOLMU|nr:hypothetical protein QYE76_008061 [Lolium multiflorum]KAK1679100.1 hypothetical protein QYE76_039948 [Lolium multiflorum]KAK1679103.1 hypothetical protein QYE76_039951 [Lolium multiflorum]